MGNCTTKQDSPRNHTNNMNQNWNKNEQKIKYEEQQKNDKRMSKSTTNTSTNSHKHSLISTTENNNTGQTNISSLLNISSQQQQSQQMIGQSNSNNNSKQQISNYNNRMIHINLPGNLEQIEELESSNYFQSEIQTIEAESKTYQFIHHTNQFNHTNSINNNNNINNNNLNNNNINNSTLNNYITNSLNLVNSVNNMNHKLNDHKIIINNNNELYNDNEEQFQNKKIIQDNDNGMIISRQNTNTTNATTQITSRGSGISCEYNINQSPNKHNQKTNNINNTRNKTYTNTSTINNDSPITNTRDKTNINNNNIKKTNQEIRNILRMQKERFFSIFISEDLNNILKSGVSIQIIMQHFEFANHNQIIELIKDIYSSILNKKNKLNDLLLNEHVDIVKSFISSAYLTLDRGIQNYIKSNLSLNTLSSNPNSNVNSFNPTYTQMTNSNNCYSQMSSNSLFNNNINNNEIINEQQQLNENQQEQTSIQILQVLVETYQVIQYYILQRNNNSYIIQNKWWTKNQNEKDLSQFSRKFVRLSQLLNSIQINTQNLLLTPNSANSITQHKRSQKDKHKTMFSKYSYHIDLPFNQSKSIEINHDLSIQLSQDLDEQIQQQQEQQQQQQSSSLDNKNKEIEEEKSFGNSFYF